MLNILHDFMQEITNKRICIYNEFSVQHELDIFLRNRSPELTIQFERNISHFGLQKKQFEKREIDIVGYTDTTQDLVIELKFPRNGQVPETIFSFCKDILFLEQLVHSGFKTGYFIAITEDPLFYSGNEKEYIKCFDQNTPFTG